jgi:asparagine synthase (glutamine-hydrolysing)
VTALAAAFGPLARDNPAAVAAMLSGTFAPEEGPTGRWSDDSSVVAARCHPWEAELSGWTGPAVYETEGHVIAADASLYYLADLRRRLSDRGELPARSSSAELVAAAVRLWGTDFARHLEGDYALIVFDKNSRRLLLAREFGGRRSLHYAVADDGTVVVASTASAVADFPGVPTDYDLDMIATSTVGLALPGDRTAFEAVRVVPPGGTVCVERGGRPYLLHQWAPPEFSDSGHGSSLDQGAEELRGLLQDAMVERLPRQGRGVVWMSGGWDSPALFASARSATSARRAPPVEVLPVSLSYPPGDRGREDELITEIAGHWRVPVSWLSVDDIALLDPLGAMAWRRDDPLAHPFEPVQRRLAQVTRSLGARVAFDGNGGDFLFMASSAVLADHLRLGNVSNLVSAWRQWGRDDVRDFLRACILPLLAPDTIDWIGAVRGRPLHGYWDFTAPDWLRRRAGVSRALRPPVSVRLPGEGAAAFEARYLLTNPMLWRLASATHAFALDEGVELRSPFLDRRIVEFAAGRPLEERNCNDEIKVLLRHAMRGLLPDSVLAPRRSKTGAPVDYVQRSLLRTLPSRIETTFRFGGSAVLVRMDLVDAGLLRQASAAYAEHGGHLLGSRLLMTLQTEKWLADRELRA